MLVNRLLSMPSSGADMSEKKAPQPYFARITSRLGWAALVLWPGLTLLQLTLFWMSRSYRESTAAASAAVWAEGSIWAGGVPVFGLFTLVGILCALAWGGCWTWRLAAWFRRHTGGAR